MVSERKEDYLEAIDEISQRNGIVKAVEVSRALGIGPSSVTEMFQKLAEEGYLNYEKYNGVTLTEEGRKVAMATRDRHETLRSFLEIIGVGAEVADEDACRIEHVVTPKTMEQLEKFVAFVGEFEEFPTWLKHFRHFLETGRIIKLQDGFPEEECFVCRARKNEGESD